MFKRVLIAAAIVIVSPASVFAQNVSFLFGEGAAATDTSTTTLDAGSGSVFIYSEVAFAFDAIDLDFKVSDPNVIQLTGGETFDPTFDVIGGMKFDSSVLFRDVLLDGGGMPLLDANGEPILSTTDGRLLSINITRNGVNPAVTRLFDPSFDMGVGTDGAILLARVDYDIVGIGTANLEFTLGTNGAVLLIANNDTEVLNPTLGSATLTVVSELSGEVVTVSGTQGPDEILVEQVGDQIAVDVNGVLTGVHDLQNVSRVEIFGFGGRDRIEVDAAVATFISGGFGPDEIIGGRLENEIQGGPGPDMIFGGPLADNINAGRGLDVVYAFGGDDVISGGDAADMLFGGAGDDEIVGGLGADTLVGGSGNDELLGNTGADSLLGGGGDDFLSGQGGPDELFGGPGADDLLGGEGFDLLNGGSGFDNPLDQGEIEIGIEG